METPKCKTCHIYPRLALLISPSWKHQMLCDGWKLTGNEWQCERCQQDEAQTNAKEIGQ